MCSVNSDRMLVYVEERPTRLRTEKIESDALFAKSQRPVIFLNTGKHRFRAYINIIHVAMITICDVDSDLV